MFVKPCLRKTMKMKSCLCLVVLAILIKTLFAFNARIGTFKVEKRRNPAIRACAKKILKEIKYFNGDYLESTERNCSGLNNSPRDDMIKDRGNANLKTKYIEHIFTPAVPQTSLILPRDAVLSVDTTLKSEEIDITALEHFAQGTEGLGVLDSYWMIFLNKSPTTQIIANKEGGVQEMCNYTYLLQEERTRFSFKILVDNTLEILLDNKNPCKFNTRGPDKMSFSFNEEDIYSAKLTYF